MTLTIAQIAYPFAPVGPDAVGGAEQIAHQLDVGLARLGHRSILVAGAGSQAAQRGLLCAAPPGAIDDAARDAVHAQHRRNIVAAITAGADLLHLHGIDFPAYLPPPGIPTVVTLHLPPEWYDPTIFQHKNPRTWLVPVSAHQQRACPPSDALLPPIGNGVPVERLRAPISRRGYALALGRICPEKNLHEALDAGTAAGLPVLLGGQVFPYPDHQRYWTEMIAPRLAAGPHRFLGPLGFARKRRLLSGARCLLSASRAPETSSLVAMEAAACGTPVIAFRSGALPEIVEDGVTGLLVDDRDGMACAIGHVGRIDPARCIATARARFDAATMVDRYAALYARLLGAGGRA